MFPLVRISRNHRCMLFQPVLCDPRGGSISLVWFWITALENSWNHRRKTAVLLWNELHKIKQWNYYECLAASTQLSTEKTLFEFYVLFPSSRTGKKKIMPKCSPRKIKTWQSKMSIILRLQKFKPCKYNKIKSYFIKGEKCQWKPYCILRFRIFTNVPWFSHNGFICF